jgi:hypothetical protein
MPPAWLGVPSLVALAACSSPQPAGGGPPGGDDAGSFRDSGNTADVPGGGTDSASPMDTSSPPPFDSGPPPNGCAPSWTVTPACGGTLSPTPPDFGPNVLVFDPTMSAAAIQGQLDTVDGMQDGAQFGAGRYAYFFKPGQYSADVRVGFYVQALGLGQSPDDVVITGAVRSKADWFGGNATLNFWRAAENLAVMPTQAIDSQVDVWAVSQGTSFRRMHVKGRVALSDGGNSSGGFIADSLVDAQIISGSQQQFFTRNTDWASWTTANWNMVFIGSGPPPGGAWPHPPITVTSATPLVREKPFLYVDAGGHYLVMVPYLKSGSQGPSWMSGTPPGSPVSIDTFYLARPAMDTAASLNAALGQGKNLMFTPGIYHLEAPVQIARAGTIVMGLGLATLVPDKGTPVLSVADVDGVTLSGLLLEAGTTSSPTLLQLGDAGSSQDHSKNPTAVFDIHCRIGGANPGTASSCFTIDSSDVLVDNTWLWRADHGAGVGWTSNQGKNGLVVNGNRVTVYGLFVEHFQEYQTLWNGENGSVYFYQSEMPYDPPSQSAWQAAPGKNGYASYKVADTVTTHQAEGLGVYSVFDNNVSADDGFEAPNAASATGVALHHMVIVSLRSGSINSIFNGTGGGVGNGNTFSWSAQ